MMATEEKRLFIGGLVKGVTEEELVEKFSRFGQVSKVEVKTRATDADSSKTFAHLNLTAEDKAFKKCLTAYNNSRWKGGQLTVQLAKESFLSKLRKEQAEVQTSQQTGAGRPAGVQRSPALQISSTAVPGTPMDDNGWWVMGKYSRVVPVMHVRKPGSRKLIKVDPSKTPHCLKKLKSEDMEEEQLCDLTWQLEENSSHINQLRQGKFSPPQPPRYQSTPKDPSPLPPDSITCRLQGLAAEEQVWDTDMEVVPVGPMKTVPTLHARSAYDSDSSTASADTDDIVCKASGKNCVMTAVNHSTEMKENKNNVRSSALRSAGCRDMSSCVVNTDTPCAESRDQKTPVHPDSRRESPLKGKELNGGDTNTEGPSRPHFLFVRTPTVSGKAWKKFVKSSQSKSTFVENSSEDMEVNIAMADNRRTLSKKTPEFKGLGMLSPDTSADGSSGSKSRMLSSARQGSMSPATSTDNRSADGGSRRKSSLPVLPQKWKRSAPVSGDDSDLDDNDFEMVGKKLAARAIEGGGRRGETMDKEGQGTAAATETPTTSVASAHIARTRKTTQGEEEHMTSMERSHRAYRKLQQQQKQKESLITKTLREGTGSTHITFSDSEEDEGGEEKNAGKMSLFSEGASDDDSGSDLDFSIRPQFEGKKGRKLFELQSRITDRRFHFDERFQSDGESDDSEREMQRGSGDDLAKEKEQNLKILEKVLGHKPAQKTRLVYEEMSKKRYNPLSADHPVSKNKPKKRRKPDQVESPSQKHSEHDAESDSSASHCGQDTEVHGPSSDPMEQDWEHDTDSDTVSGHTRQEEEEDDTDSDTVSGHTRQEEEEDDTDSDTVSGHKRQEEEEDDTDSDTVSGHARQEEDDTDSDTVSGHAQQEEEEDDTDSDTASRHARQEEEEDGCVPVSSAPGEGLKDLFGGGSAFTFFGAPDSGASEETQAVRAVKSMEVEEEEDDTDDEEETAVERKPRPQEADSSQLAVQQRPSFRVAWDDPRLVAAVKFFRRPSPEEFEELCQHWPEERQKVMQVVRERHKKACRKQRQLKQGVKSRTSGKTKPWTITKGKK